MKGGDSGIKILLWFVGMVLLVLSCDIAVQWVGYHQDAALAETNSLCFNMLSVCLDGSCSAIPDGGDWSYSQTQSPGDPAFWIQDVNVGIGDTGPIPGQTGIDHPDLTQIEIWLEGPNGWWTLLYDGALGVSPGGTTINGLLFDDEASVSVLEGVSPYNGSFQPIESMHAWDSWYMDGGPEDTFTIHIIDNNPDGITGNVVMLSVDVCGTGVEPPPTAIPSPIPSLTPTPPPICPPLPSDGFGMVGGAVASIYRVSEDECFNIWASDAAHVRMLHDFRDGVYDLTVTSLWMDIGSGAGNYNTPWSWHAKDWSVGPDGMACDMSPSDIESQIANQWWLDDSATVCMSDVEIVEITERRPELDSNDNQMIDIVDITHAAKLFGLSFPDAGYDPQWDVYPDQTIDLLDLVLLANSWHDQLPVGYGLVADLSTIGPQCGSWELWEYNVDVASGDDGYLYWLEADVGGKSVHGAAVSASAGVTTTLTVRSSAEATNLHVRVAGSQAIADNTAHSASLPVCVPGNPVVVRTDGVDPFDPDTMAHSTVIDVTSTDPQGPPIITQSQKVAQGFTDADVAALGIVVVADSAPDAGRLLISQSGNQVQQFSIGIPKIHLSFTTIYEQMPQGLGLFGNFLVQTSTIPGLMEIWGQTMDLFTEQLVWADRQPPQMQFPTIVQWVHGAGAANPLPRPGRRLCTIADYWYDGRVWDTGVDCTMLTLP